MTAPRPRHRPAGALATGRVDPTPLLTRTVGLAHLDDTFAPLAGSLTEIRVDPAGHASTASPQEDP